MDFNINQSDGFNNTCKNLGDLSRSKTSWGSFNPGDSAKSGNGAGSLNKNLIPDANGNQSLTVDAGKSGTGSSKPDSLFVKNGKPAGNKGGLPSDNGSAG